MSQSPDRFKKKHDRELLKKQRYDKLLESIRNESTGDFKKLIRKPDLVDANAVLFALSVRRYHMALAIADKMCEATRKHADGVFFRNFVRSNMVFPIAAIEKHILEGNRKLSNYVHEAAKSIDFFDILDKKIQQQMAANIEKRIVDVPSTLYEKVQQEDCLRCGGTGKIKCPNCGGSGILPDNDFFFERKCKTCHGKKEIKCKSCA